jgi:diguanylate cyclase (GGDEF)-like protein
MILKKLFELFENLNEIVYISDTDTRELVYMNRKTREFYNIPSMEEVRGRHCYEILQESLCPCALCNKDKLKVGEFYEWDYFNPIMHRRYLIKDTLLEEDGHRYRLEIAFEQKQTELHDKILNQYINNEQIINEGLQLSLSYTNPDEAFNVLLEYVGKALKCERIYIFEEKEGHYYNSYEWCSTGVTPQIQNLQYIPYEDASIWLTQFQRHENVVIRDLELIRECNPVIYEYLQPQDIHSIVVSPLTLHNKVIGFFGVDNPPEEFLDNISTLFMILGHFIVSSLRRRDLYKQMENLSYNDQLTGFGNRHLMEHSMAALQPCDSLGIVYCDVTGLKMVNDTQGHKAGDQLLIRACKCLRRVFPDHMCFRVGGDEFLVLCPGITEKELASRREQLKEDMTTHNVMMALGCIWCPDSNQDIDKLIAEADRLMYQDKREYYASKAKE